ncbi:MAG: glycosyltransferase [Candidatus Aminicenantes bacterium]|nr:glycosyltransferase [Candidatus Aminicenantes bacterium]
MITLDNLLFLILLAIFFNTIINLKRMAPHEPEEWSKEWPFVSILVPVRNEERNLEPLLQSLLNQDYPHYEIIVMDDGSTDNTWSILKKWAALDSRLRIERSQELPPGWTGKNWVCHQLSRLAKGDFFLFTDADTIHYPDSLKKAIASSYFRRARLLSALPELEARTWSEKLFMPLIPLALISLLPFFKVNPKKGRSYPVALGPFLLFERRAYLSCGGHEANKGNIVDDIALARQANRNGQRIIWLDGSRLFRIRFYTCFSEVWNGFSKNSYEAIKGTPLKVLIATIVCYLLFIRPYLSLLESLSQAELAFLPFLQVIVISLTRFLLAERFGTSLTWILLHPVSIIFALLILLNSCRLTIFGKKIAWKERFYPLP